LAKLREEKMTPTLIGRWQTRIFLLATVGVLASLPFYFGITGHGGSLTYFWVLFYVGLFGCVWDVVYNYLMGWMWDHDWPGILQLLAGIWEGLFLGTVLKVVGLPYIPTQRFDLGDFILHYSVVWVCLYLSAWVVMRILFPRWRFRGGEWLGPWPRSGS
jgi:hypothetical protein